MDAGDVRVVVVGGGVAGMTVAYRLTRPGDRERPDVTVVEADHRVGGKLRSIDVGGLTLEAGADSFLARKPWAVELCRELGLSKELHPPGTSGSFLWTDDGLVRFPRDAAFGIPPDVGEVVRWPGVSPRGRLRALRDLVRKPRKDDGDESLGSLLRRRVGDEATELAIAPLLAGLFAGDVDRLSVRATFPELATWERTQGSLVRGSQAARRASADAGPRPMFLRLRGGMPRLIEALAAATGRERLLLDDPAASLGRRGPAWVVGTTGGAIDADVVVFAAPAFESARLLGGIAPASSAGMAEIPYASTGVVFLVYPEGTAEALPDGSGFVVPAGRAPMTACTWLSRKWPSEAYGSRAVLRCYVGGAGFEEVVEAPDEDIVDAVARHVSAVLPLPRRPEASAVYRWRRAMPQYEIGHVDRVRAIRDGLPDGIFVTGSAFAGVGIPDCVRDANETAEAVLRHASGRPSEKETVR
jgi:protoporphyrinogen/coproporphyrinogen III oxidase